MNNQLGHVDFPCITLARPCGGKLIEIYLQGGMVEICFKKESKINI